MLDSKERFTPCVEHYVKHRPSYPVQAIDCLMEACGLAPGMAAADIGAGTGKLTGLLLQRGLHVSAVEPNEAMRSAAEQAFAGTPGFTSVAASAEEIGLPASAFDAVTAAQAFHWFDRARFKAECQRILRPGGHVALLWNRRDTEDPFMAQYEAIIEQYHGDRPNQAMKQIDRAVFDDFFTTYGIDHFSSAQVFDYDGLAGRALSSSYAPRPGHPAYEPLLTALRNLFEQNENNGQIPFVYCSEVVVGIV